MNTRALGRSLAGIVLTGLITGCGAAGDSTSGPPLGGIDGGGFAHGTITGFGSIIVNGVEYSTTNATFTIDGRPGSQADLHVGDVVSIEGSIDGTSGTADSVFFDDAVEGPVQSVDVAASSLVVMGQTVLVDGATSFDDSPAGCQLATLLAGQVVEVSGFRTASDEVRATRIECKAAGGELEITGVVAALDAAQHRFQIGALTVDYTSAQLQNFPGGQPANGQAVEVKGMTFAGGVLTATRVEFKDTNLPADNGDDVEFEGLITRFASQSDFDVSGQRVATSGSTEFSQCGAAPITLALNTQVEVDGTFQAGAINATKVECKTGTSLRVRSTVTAVNAAASTFSILGIPVTVDSKTRFEDQSNADLSPFHLSDLHVGDFAEVRGAAGSAANSILAALVERNDFDADSELRGSAESVSAPDFLVLGVTVHTDGGTEFHDENDQTITSTAFFTAAPAHLVKVKGAVIAGAIVADEVDLEN